MSYVEGVVSNMADKAGRKAVSILLSFVLMVVPLAACSQQAGHDGEGDAVEEEMNRDFEASGEAISVATSGDGAYQVTITEANLMVDEVMAIEIPEVVTAEEAGVAEEEMTRDDPTLAEYAGDEYVELEEPDAWAAEDIDDEAVEMAEPADEQDDSEYVAADEGAEEAVGQEDLVDEMPEQDQLEPFDEEQLEEPEVEEEAEVEEETPEEWGLATVKQEDVKVCYNVPVPIGEGEDAEYEYVMLEADVTGFANNDGIIDLSFQAGEPGDALSRTYTIRFEGTESYAVVQTSPVIEDVIGDVDYDAQIAEAAGYEPDFTEADIALPEGTYIEDGQVIVTEDATEMVQDTLSEMGVAEEEMSRGDGNADDSPLENPGEDDDSAAVQYMKEFNARTKQYSNYDAVASYTPQILSEIDPRAGEVAEFGANAYKLFKAYTTNNWGAGFEGSIGVLKMFGLFKGGSGGISNAQILSEVQKVGLEVADMHSLTKAMNSKLDETLRQAYANNLQPFDNAVIAMNTNAEPLQIMLTEGAIRAAEDGIEPPAEDCTAEDEFEYNYDLIEYIKGLEKKGGRKNSAFAGFEKHMEGLTQNFTLVAGEVAKQAEQNPITAYDKYWNLYFNYESQGYYLRRSYRANIEYELKRAFAIMEIYYNIFDPYTKGTHLTYNSLLFGALSRLEELDAGVSPEMVKKKTSLYSWNGFTLRCTTFDRIITSVSYATNMQGTNVSTGLLEEYIKRLHGRSLADDLNLAGIWYGRLAAKDKNGVTTAINQQWYGDASTYVNGAHGIGFNGTYKDSWYKADIIGYDKKLHKEEQTLSSKGKTLSNPFDKPWSTEWAYSMPYMVFQFV